MQFWDNEFKGRESAKRHLTSIEAQRNLNRYQQRKEERTPPPMASHKGAPIPSASTYQIIRELVQFSSVTQSCSTLCDPMDCSMPGLPVHHQLLEFTQTHVHWVGDAIQPSHPLSSPSPPGFNLSQHQGLFKWVSSLHRWRKYRSFSFNISPSKIRGSGNYLARCH